MGPTPQVDGVFEIYSFADRTTRVWTPDPQYGDIREFVLVDQTTLVVLEEIELRLTIAAVDLSSGSRTVFAQTDGSSMALGQLSYAAGTLVWMDETRGAQLVTRPTAPPNTGSGGWSLPAGAWAEYPWASLSPDGGFLGRIRQLPTAPAQPLESQLEITPRGSLLPQVVLRGAGSFHWESEESILAVVGSGSPRNPVRSLVRVGRGGGATTLVTSLESSRVGVVYPR